VLGDRPNQLDRQRPDVHVTADQLLDVSSAQGDITETGLRNNLYVSVAYVAAWLAGNGAVAIHNLMEDAATAEISRSQVWQWVRSGASFTAGEGVGTTITADLVRTLLGEETARLRADVGPETYDAGPYEQARTLVEGIALDDHYVDFLTLPAYDAVVAAESSDEAS
jgi:malate synthase